VKQQIQRIYLKGWDPAVDFGPIKPNHIIVEPLKPSKDDLTEGGIVLPGQAVGNIPGVACFCYRVIARGEYVVGDGDRRDPAVWSTMTLTDGDEALLVKPGDVVMVRNAALDPIHVNQRQLIVHVRHVLSIVNEVADVVEAAPEPDPTRGVMLVQRPL